MGYILSLGILLSSGAFLVHEQNTHINKVASKQILMANNWSVNGITPAQVQNIVSSNQNQDQNQSQEPHHHWKPGALLNYLWSLLFG